MTDPMLDMSVEAMTAPRADDEVPEQTGWLSRRMRSWGASDLPVLYLALGIREASTVPSYMRDRAKPIKVAGGKTWPRIVLEKAGRRRPLAVGDAALIGQRRERELLETWRATLTERDAIDPATVTHASAVPEWLWPMRDAGHRLAVTPDAWATDAFGDVVLIECKCPRRARESLPWYWELQTQAQMAVTGHSLALVVCGQGWGWSMDATGPIDVWPVRRDEAAITEIRDACARGWQMVEQAKQEAT